MDQDLVEMWAEIGSKPYWEDLLNATFVPFEERWPQPGFVGTHYFDSSTHVVVMGQNPRASNTQRASSADRKMFHLIRSHSENRTAESLKALFEMMGKFLLGIEPYRPAWRPITAARKHLNLQLDDIAYLNLIPLATHRRCSVPAFREAFDRATKRQLNLLDPAKIVVYGKGAYTTFMRLGGGQWNVRYIEQRNYHDAADVKIWLGSE